MTEHTLTPEFDYFHIEISDLIAQAITGGGMMDADDRAKSAIRYIHDAIEARGTAYSHRAWSLAIETYTKMLMGDGNRYEFVSGCVQGDSLTDSPLQYWVVPMSSQNRGTLSGYQFMVLWCEGYMVGQIDGAFMCDSWDVALDIIHPTRAEVFCGNGNCTAQFKIEDGVSLYVSDPETGDYSERYNPESHEYDADGINCPACTVYVTDLGETSARHNSADNVLAQGDGYSTRPTMPGYFFDAFKLTASLYIGD